MHYVVISSTTKDTHLVWVRVDSTAIYTYTKERKMGENNLYRYSDGEYLRAATNEEIQRSATAGDVGAITVMIEGIEVTCYVAK